MFESRRPDTQSTGIAPASTGATLYVGTRAASSWSLRAWLALDLARRPFELVEIDLYAPDRAERLAEVSPSGKVPLLATGGTLIWDSLAIMEWAADLAPELWPSHARRRAVARSVVAEMHAGFAALRQTLPMDWFARYELAEPLPVHAGLELHRITGLWRELLAESGRGGFLFGQAPTLADVAYVPVASRLVTYGLVPEEPVVRDYVERLVTLPSLGRWFRGVEQRAVLPKPPPIAVGAVRPRPAPVRAPEPPPAAGPAAGPAASPRRLEDVVARARDKGTVRPLGGETPSPPPVPAWPPAEPARRSPAPPPPEEPAEEPRPSASLPWLRRRDAQPETAPGGGWRRRPPPKT